MAERSLFLGGRKVRRERNYVLRMSFSIVKKKTQGHPYIFSCSLMMQGSPHMFSCAIEILSKKVIFVEKVPWVLYSNWVIFSASFDPSRARSSK